MNIIHDKSSSLHKFLSSLQLSKTYASGLKIYLSIRQVLYDGLLSVHPCSLYAIYGLAALVLLSVMTSEGKFTTSRHAIRCSLTSNACIGFTWFALGSPLQLGAETRQVTPVHSQDFRPTEAPSRGQIRQVTYSRSALPTARLRSPMVLVLLEVHLEASKLMIIYYFFVTRKIIAQKINRICWICKTLSNGVD
jgi:hypothetical protein